MGVFKPLSFARRLWKSPDKRDAPARFARRLVVTAKARARKPISIVPSTKRIWPPRAPDAPSDTSVNTHVTTIAPLRPTAYPQVPDEPLVDPAYWRNLPAKLERPYFTDVSPEKMVAAQPGYEGLLPKYVRSGWSHVGYSCLKMYRKIFIDPPKTALPEGYNLAMSDGGIVASATHIFGVYALAPPGTSDPAARRRKHPAFRRTVDLYPTHGAIWSAYCARLPTMAQPPAKAKVYNDPRPGTRAHRASVLRLPIVPVAVPHPPSFYALMQFVYSYRKSGLINTLVPCEGFALPPDQLTDPPPEVTLPVFAQALAQKCTLLKLCQMAKNVHGAYRNMICLGVVEPRMWDAIDYAWAAVLAAMDLVEKNVDSEMTSD